jgi:hypothetical protein
MAYCYDGMSGITSAATAVDAVKESAQAEPVNQGVEAVDAAADTAAAVAVADGNRPCTKAELAKQKKEHDEMIASMKTSRDKEQAEFSALFGYSPGDDAANQRMAAQLMKQEGWKSAKYMGKGVFEVDYKIAGRTGHDFIFPMMEQSDVIFPFVTIRPRADGSVMVSAPGLTGGAAKALALRGGMLGLSAMGGSAKDAKDMMGSPRVKGSFTITTDGQIMTNNTDDGASAVANGQALNWAIDQKTDKIPESLIKLK